MGRSTTIDNLSDVHGGLLPMRPPLVKFHRCIFTAVATQPAPIIRPFTSSLMVMMRLVSGHTWSPIDIKSDVVVYEQAFHTFPLPPFVIIARSL